MTRKKFGSNQVTAKVEDDNTEDYWGDDFVLTTIENNNDEESTISSEITDEFVCVLSATTEKDTISVTIALLTATNRQINASWIFLDSEATNHVFCNDELLYDVQSDPIGIRIFGHSGGP